MGNGICILYVYIYFRKHSNLGIPSAATKTEIGGNVEIFLKLFLEMESEEAFPMQTTVFPGELFCRYAVAQED